jgi:pyruvate formate lyase activating enzyme
MAKCDVTPSPPHPITGLVWDIKKYAIHDGPGIRTTVFFKGCPLCCRWCCNPESQEAVPEIIYFEEKCSHCDRCRTVCPSGAISVDRKGNRCISRNQCDACGLCAAICPSKALNVVGKRMTVSDVLSEVLSDASFYQRSGGGLTITGGEPAAQPQFAYHLLRQYKSEERGRHTAIETCGFVPWSDLRLVIEQTDLVLYDIKHMDGESHLRATGADNQLILENAQRVAESGGRLVVRFPLIPGFNDSEENIRRTADFASKLQTVQGIDILPYHRLGEPKYRRLGRRYSLTKVRPILKVRLSETQKLLEGYGLRVGIGG